MIRLAELESMTAGFKELPDRQSSISSVGLCQPRPACPKRASGPTSNLPERRGFDRGVG